MKRITSRVQVRIEVTLEMNLSGGYVGGSLVPALPDGNDLYNGLVAVTAHLPGALASDIKILDYKNLTHIDRMKPEHLGYTWKEWWGLGNAGPEVIRQG